MTFRDTPTACEGYALTQRYDHTIFRLEHSSRRISSKGSVVIEIELPDDMEMEDSTPLRTRDALYGGRTETIFLH